LANKQQKPRQAFFARIKKLIRSLDRQGVAMPPLRIGVCYLEGDLGDERVFAFKSAEGKGTVNETQVRS
jgi:hypothetical protein